MQQARQHGLTISRHTSGTKQKKVSLKFPFRRKQEHTLNLVIVKNRSITMYVPERIPLILTNCLASLECFGGSRGGPWMTTAPPFLQVRSWGQQEGCRYPDVTKPSWEVISRRIPHEQSFNRANRVGLWRIDGSHTAFKVVSCHLSEVTPLIAVGISWSETKIRWRG